MNSQFQGLRTCIYKVPDIKKAKEWYTRILGIGPYFDQAFYVGFNVGGFELGLQPIEKIPSVQSDNILTYWAVEDVDDTYQRLLKEGASPHELPSDVGGGIIVATVKDPWGNIVGIIYNPHFQIPT
jgi:predicted enzyme related to lactoylglutathione lyase